MDDPLDPLTSPSDPGAAPQLAVADALARAWAGAPGVRAVLLCGSVSRGWADRWSDVELVVCWEDAPSAEARADLARAVGTHGRREYGTVEQTGAFEEELRYAGTKVDVAHLALVDVATVLDAVTRDCDTAPGRHALVAGLRDAVALSGADLLRGWQTRAAVYPARLRTAMVARHLVLGPHWWLRMLADRDDVLLLHDVLCRVERALLGVALALSSTYAISETFKWSARVATGLAVAPGDFPGRLRHVLTASPADGVREACALIDETLDLVAVHAPEVMLGPVRARVHAAAPDEVRAAAQDGRTRAVSPDQPTTVSR